jgi:hypothetical protein
MVSLSNHSEVAISFIVLIQLQELPRFLPVKKDGSQ